MKCTLPSITPNSESDTKVWNGSASLFTPAGSSPTCLYDMAKLVNLTIIHRTARNGYMSASTTRQTLKDPYSYV